MIKSMKNLALAVCLLAAIPTASIQARSVPAIVVGSVLTVGGTAWASIFLGAEAGLRTVIPFWNSLRDDKDKKKLDKQVLGGAVTAVAGLCLLGYGASR